MATKYWVSSSNSSFDNTNNWSLSSGGSSGTSIPGSTDTIIYDESGIGSCTLNIDTTIAGFNILTGYTGTFSQSTYNIEINDATFSDGTFQSSSGDMVFTGSCKIEKTVYDSTNALKFTGSNAQSLIVSDNITLPTLIVNKSSNSLTADGTGSLNINGDLTILDGTFNSNLKINVGNV